MSNTFFPLFLSFHISQTTDHFSFTSEIGLDMIRKKISIKFIKKDEEGWNETDTWRKTNERQTNLGKGKNLNKLIKKRE